MRIDSEMLVAFAFAGLLIAFVLAQRRTFLATVDAKRPDIPRRCAPMVS